ncbi:glycosyltransferase [Edwardsiella tarda]|uniref:glycosyltransferase n=1 Tax=Edwardsiella tarda TaxID=636 RepID=UPI00351C81F2
MVNKCIVHLVNLRDFGGVEQLVLSYILDNKKYNNIVINTSNSLNKKLNKYSNEIIFCNRIIQNHEVQYPSFIRKKILWDRIKRIDPSHVIIWNQVISLNGKPDSIKAIYYDHGASWELEKNKKTIDFFKKIDGCICVSNASKKMIENSFKHNCNVSVLLNKAKHNTQGKDSKNHHKNTKFTIGCAARFSPIKALGLIPLIAEETKKRGFDFKFIIAGSGEEESALINLIKNKKLENDVLLAGFINDLDDFYNDLDIYISTSAHETCSLACIEAMSFGLPIISANIDGQPEIISNNSTGFCISPTMTMDEYCIKTEMAYPFNGKIYYPEHNSINTPLLLSPSDAADKIIKLYIDGTDNYKKNAINRAKTLFNADNFEEDLAKIIRNF